MLCRNAHGRLLQHKELVCGPAGASAVETEPASAAAPSAGQRAPGRKGPSVPELETHPWERKGEGNTKVV